jgi:hypothetical protein
MRIVFSISVFFAVSVIAPTAGGDAATGFAVATKANVFPTKLVGRWTRTVTSADIKRTGGSGIPAGTVCTLTIKRSGAAGLHTTTVGDFDGSLVPAGVDRVHILLGLPDPDLYRWRVSGSLLTFTKLKDTVGDREAAMEGIWKRK